MGNCCFSSSSSKNNNKNTTGTGSGGGAHQGVLTSSATVVKSNQESGAVVVNANHNNNYPMTTYPVQQSHQNHNHRDALEQSGESSRITITKRIIWRTLTWPGSAGGSQTDRQPKNDSLELSLSDKDARNSTLITFTLSPQKLNCYWDHHHHQTPSLMETLGAHHHHHHRETTEWSCSKGPWTF